MKLASVALLAIFLTSDFPLLAQENPLQGTPAITQSPPLQSNESTIDVATEKPSGVALDSEFDLNGDSESQQVAQQATQEAAQQLIQQVIHRLAFGRPFDAKIRHRIWTAGREMVGVGTYEQAGGGTGRFNMQVTMHDGDGKHTLQQISDGRLAWTRSVISDKITLRRVDVGRLNEWVRDASRQENTSPTYVPPKLKVGALTEMLDMIQRDYDLKMGKIRSAPLLGISGTLSSEARKRTLLESGAKDWPTLLPTRIMIAIAAEPLPNTNFGQGLPVRIEFWSDPVIGDDSSQPDHPEGRLISLLEIYSVRAIDAPPVERFRFETQDYSIKIINETDRYLRRYGVRLTDSQRKQLRR
ncbi:hypothetical protein [Planctomycetes bacterium K23_9]|uniref:hypothetical protein n=1 Tax=Stieleria marina TaxID=1930275 RepID=UPI0011A0FCB4